VAAAGDLGRLARRRARTDAQERHFTEYAILFVLLIRGPMEERSYMALLAAGDDDRFAVSLGDGMRSVPARTSGDPHRAMRMRRIKK
jgi:hypothetical protein